MTMYMCILMFMNIYITKQNEDLLKKEPSMSGLINQLLTEHYEHEHSHTYKQKVVNARKASIVSPSSEPKIIKTKEQANEKVQELKEKPGPITYKKTSNWGA